MPRWGPTTASESKSALPRRFGDYVLLEQLAQGLRGDVYVAAGPNTATGSAPCVIKCLRAELMADRGYVARFMAEARTAVQLQHPHIASVVDVGMVGGSYYLAIEHVAGRTLHEILERAGTERAGLPLPVALTVVSDLLDALDYAHRRTNQQTGKPLGFVHGEVSPASVMVSYQGELKLTDVGLARSALELERTLPGDSPGRLCYQAPEQVRGEDFDERADVFAAAVLCFELLRGERFYASKPADVVWQLASVGGYLPSSFARLPSGLRAVLEAALRADPATRTKTADQLRRELLASQHEARPAPGVLRSFMTALYPGAAAASRRHVEALAHAQAIALPKGGATVRFVEQGPIASAEAPTVVRNVSSLRDSLPPPGAEDGVPPTTPSRPRFELPSTDVEDHSHSHSHEVPPAPQRRPVPTDVRAHDELRPLPLTEADVVTEPDARPASLAALRRAAKGSALPDVTAPSGKPPVRSR